MSSRFRFLILALCLSGARSGGAQVLVDTTAFIRGTVYDSLLTDAPLRGAEVWLEGTNRTARTDVGGRFEFVGLRPGRYVLTFFHPVLDSAGFAAAPVEVSVAAGLPSIVLLTTPSPVSVHRSLCPRDPSASVGAVLGLVREVPGGKPLRDVPVTAEWTAFTIAGGGNRWEPRSTVARSDSLGRVLLCAVPTDVKVLLRGQTAGGTSGMLAVDLAGRPFGRANLYLLEHPEVGTATGVVRTRAGRPVQGSMVVAVGTDKSVQADPEGRFTLSGIEAGSRIFEARAIGFPPTQLQATIVAGSASRLEFILGEQAQILEPIAVAGSSFLANVGFERRRKSGQGHFIDTSYIAKSGATRTEEIFRMVPGLVLHPSGMGYVVEFQRAQGQIMNTKLKNYCAPSYFIDGGYFPLPPNAAITLPMVPQEILAIEIYSNMFSAPLQFQRRDSGCGVILIWTRRGQGKSGQ